MSKPRDTSTDTSSATADSTIPADGLVQPTQPQPVSDSFGNVPTGDDMLKDPIIINR